MSNSYQFLIIYPAFVHVQMDLCMRPIGHKYSETLVNTDEGTCKSVHIIQVSM